MATKFDAVLGSELRDTQSEILDIKGADISELLAGRGVVNDNHSNKLPDVLGRITSAKKIFGIEDCEPKGSVTTGTKSKRRTYTVKASSMTMRIIALLKRPQQY